MSASPDRAMTVRFIKLSDRRHRVEVHRADGTTDAVELDSRSFLRHDLAHYAVEATLALTGGVWGSIAAGGHFDGSALDGADMALAERLAGPVQTMMRVGAGVEDVRATLARVAPLIADAEVAAWLQARMRALEGEWRSTRHGHAMTLRWPPGA